jgi:hypothetical protein
VSNCLLATLLIAASATATYADDAVKDDAVKPDRAGASPLERLRLRSPSKRWDALKHRLKPFANRSAASVAFQPVILPVPNEAPVVAPDAAGSAEIPASTLQESAPDESAQEIQPNIAVPTAGHHIETAIGEILPYFDYEPSEVAAQEKDCKTICPCANGIDCRKPGGTKPCPCPEDDIKQPWIVKTYTPRAFDEKPFNWDASNVFSYPLYFEDKALERYGHTHLAILQPFISIQRVGGQLALLPYQMAIKRPQHHRYALGYYRPGECAPGLHYQIPLNAKAALVQASVMTGAFLIFP